MNIFTMKESFIQPKYTKYNQILTITLLAFALRITFIESRLTTIDEVSSFKYIANQNVWYIATHYHTNIHLLTSILARLIDPLGHWLTFYRMPSLIFGVLTIPLTYQLGRRFFSKQIGLIGALLLAVAPYHIDYSIQMRGYATVTFWAVVMYYGVWQALQQGKWRYWLIFSIGAILAVYAHLFGALAVGSSYCIAFATYWWHWKKENKPPCLKQLIGSLLLTIVCLAILYGPIINRIINTPTEEQEWGTQVESLWVDGHLNNNAFEDYLKILRLYGPIGEPQSWFIYSFVLLAAIGLLTALLKKDSNKKQTQQAGLYSTIWIFLPMLTAAFGLQFINGFYVFRRFFIFLQPLYLLLMAGGIVVVAQTISQWLKQPIVSKVLVVGLIIAALGGASWKLTDQLTEDTHQQWVRVAQLISNNSTNLIVVCEVQGQAMQEKASHKDDCLRNLEFYFQTDLGKRVHWLHHQIDALATIPGANQYPELKEQAGDVWLVIWQPEWPVEWPNLLQTPRIKGLTYYTIGSTLLIQATNRPVQLLALADIVDALIPLETTPQDKFSYYMSQAQMKAIIGDREAAREAWLAAQALSPEGIDAENRLRAVAELIGMMDLLK